MTLAWEPQYNYKYLGTCFTSVFVFLLQFAQLYFLFRAKQGKEYFFVVRR